MKTSVKDFMVRLVITAVWITTVWPKEEDVCLWKQFDAICEENEVIQMEQAKYGRMSVGPCIRESHRMGCQEDVLNYLDSVCSGRQSCKLGLSDYLTIGPQPCDLGLQSYLHVQYTCIPVYASLKPCAGDPIRVPETQGLLANFVTEQTGQGSPECPWVIRGIPGQKVRLTLHDFGLWAPSTSQGDTPVGQESGIKPTGRSDICHIYAKITEDMNRNPITVCGGESRDKEFYLSKTEGVHIAITNPKHTAHKAYFLLRYEIIGCPNYIPPKGAVVTQNGNDISVRCTNTGSHWLLSCDGTRWHADRNATNCTGTGVPAKAIETVTEWSLTWPQGILIIFIMSIAVLIAVLILVIGIVSLRRRRETIIGSRQTPWIDPDKHNLPPKYTSKEPYPMLYDDERARRSLMERGYATTERSNVHPDATRGRELPLLPISPTSSVPVAGTFQHGRRRDFRNHFYHELDPEHIQYPTESTPNHTLSDTETLGRVRPVAPPPDLCPPSSRGTSGVDNI